MPTIIDILTAPTVTPLFIPLRREWFEAFARGEKRHEWRRYGPRWNETSCRIGRPVELSLGYGRHKQLNGTIVGFECRQIGEGRTYPAGTLCAVIEIELH